MISGEISLLTGDPCILVFVVCTVRLRLGATRAKNFEREFAPRIICLGQSEVQSQGEGKRRKKRRLWKNTRNVGNVWEPGEIIFLIKFHTRFCFYNLTLFRSGKSGKEGKQRPRLTFLPPILTRFSTSSSPPMRPPESRFNESTD